MCISSSWIVPVLEWRFPVASRYSNDLVNSLPVLNIFIISSVLKLPDSLLPLLSKDSFTDTNHAVIFSCEKVLVVKPHV